MNWLEALILGIIQGLTEFLPVSSSGHLQIGESLLDIDRSKYDSLTFNVVVHAATSISALIVFRKDLIQMTRGLLTWRWNEEYEYAAKLALSSVPVVIVGLTMEKQVSEMFDGDVLFTGWMLLITAGLLLFTVLVKRNDREIGYGQALLIGMSQAIAVIPGISRSGSTIATALFLGIDKAKAAKFSFLMVIIPIMGKATLDTWAYFFPDAGVSAKPVETIPLAVGFVTSFLVGLVACGVMVRLVSRGKTWYFALYCLIAGLISIGLGNSWFY